MNINPIVSSNNNTNFKGAFRVANVTPQIKQEFQKYAQEGCKVFYDFSKQGDALLIAHDRLNKEISTFFKKECNKFFTFWGNITPNNYKNLDWVKKVINYSSLPGAANRTYSKWDILYRPLAMLRDIDLEVDTDKAKISMFRGVAMIDDVVNERKIFVSPKVDDVNYIKVYPYSTEKSAKYLKCKSRGSFEGVSMVYKEYKTPDEIMEFNKLFNSTKKNYDSEFMKECIEGRTNFELMLDYAYGSEELFKSIQQNYPETAKRLCYDDLFVPIPRTTFYVMNEESPEKNVQRFGKYLQRKCI